MSPFFSSKSLLEDRGKDSGTPSVFQLVWILLCRSHWGLLLLSFVVNKLV